MSEYLTTGSIREVLNREAREMETLRKFMYLVPAILWVKDYSKPEHAGVYVFVSREWEYAIVRKRDQVIGLTDYDFMPKHEAKQLQLNDQHTIEEKKTMTVQDAIGTRYNGFKPQRIALVPFSIGDSERLTHVGGYVLNQDVRTL
jgi:PAS domain-containing protein